MTHYYNEIEPYAAAWIRNLIAAGHLPAGDVDERSITDVRPDDLIGYRQCHFFAGIGGWALAARLAGWPDDRELWTGSAPCQPFSVAGKQAGNDDPRHLWPHQHRLIHARRPLVFMGEQVAAAIGKDWFDGVCFDLSASGYACRGAVIPACAVNAPHRRDRLYFAADRTGVMDHGIGEGLEGFAWHDGAASGRTIESGSVATAGSGGSVAHSDEFGEGEGWQQRGGQFGGVGGDTEDRAGAMADANPSERRPDMAARNDVDWHETGRNESAGNTAKRGAWDGAGWIIGHDGKARRVESNIRLLAHGVPARVGKLRAYGNAIVPQVAAEVIGAYMDCMP